MAEWWEDYFREAWPRIQAGGYPTERTNAECDLIERALALRPGERVLDIPCGIGRHSLELAKRGYRITGVDFKREHIDRAIAEAAAANGSAEFRVGDMREFVAPAPFDAAFCYFGSFGYFTDDGDRQFVRGVFESLKPGGRFLIEGHLAETLLPIFCERDWHWAGSDDARVQVLQERHWNMAAGRVDVTWTVVGGSDVSSHRSSIRVYTFRELRELLQSAGFAQVWALDGKTGDEFRVGSLRALVVAQKAAE